MSVDAKYYRRGGRFTLSQITPLTYRDGETYVSLLWRLFTHIREELHPSLEKSFDQLIDRLEDEMDIAHQQFVDGVEEFQRIHDAFMEDVEASLRALNDTAVADLAGDEDSYLGSTLRDLFITRVTGDDTVADYLRDTDSATRTVIETLLDDIDLSDEVAELQAGVNGVVHRLDARRVVAHHTEYGIEGGDVDSLERALSVVPRDVVLTLPVDMEFDLGRSELVIDRPVHLRGGIFRGTGHNLYVTADDVTLEDMVVIGGGNRDGNHDPGANSVFVAGTSNHTVNRFTARNVTVKNVGYTGIRVNHTHDFLVTQCHVENFRYAGIAVSSVKGGEISYNTVKHVLADSSVQWNSYGISVSNSTSLGISYRSEDIDVVYNVIDDIPHWEGIDTHNGKNINMSYNRITGCRRGIALVANMSEPLSGPTACRVIGNSIDATGSSTQHFNGVTGISMAGNGDETRKSDAVIMGNTILNAEEPVLFHHDRPKRYTWDKCVVHSNTADAGQLVSGTHFDTGWIGVADHMIWGGGVSSAGDYQFRIRVVSDGNGFTTYFRGAVTRSNASNLLFRVQSNVDHLVPGSMAFGNQDRHIIGTVDAVRSGGGRGLLCVERDRRIRFINVKGGITGNDNLFIDGVMRA